MFVEGGKTLVEAKRLVLNLYEEQQIKPYLYKTPTDLSNFNSLFRYASKCYNDLFNNSESSTC